MKHTGYTRFFAKAWTLFDYMTRGWGKGTKRFANQPAWLKTEMLDKAAQKRLMRQRKRVREWTRH